MRVTETAEDVQERFKTRTPNIIGDKRGDLQQIACKVKGANRKVSSLGLRIAFEQGGIISAKILLP